MNSASVSRNLVCAAGTGCHRKEDGGLRRGEGYRPGDGGDRRGRRSLRKYLVEDGRQAVDGLDAILQRSQDVGRPRGVRPHQIPDLAGRIIGIVAV